VNACISFHTRRRWVFGFRGACIGAEAEPGTEHPVDARSPAKGRLLFKMQAPWTKAEKRRHSPTTASFSNAGIRVKVRAIKAENACAAGIT